MKTIRPTLTLLLLVCSTCPLWAEAVAMEPAPARKARGIDWPKIARSSNGFAWALYAKLAEKEGNLFFSPSSIHTALAMTYAGARGNTLIEMAETLRFPREVKASGVGGHPGPAVTIPVDLPWSLQRVHKAYAGLLKELKPGKKAGYQLHVANALWGQKGYPWLKPFLATTRENYGAGLREVDFVKQTEAARQTINKWVEKQTEDKIKDLLAKDIVGRDTLLVLTNAIYFKGDWASKFKEKNTKDAPFKLSAGKSVKAPMMNQTGKFGYAQTKDLQVLRMPYAGEELSMVIFLPKKLDGLADVEKSLGKTGPGALLKRLRDRKVVVSVPKFKMTSKFRLDKTLSAMGMKDAFTGKADFSGMNGRKDLFISAVVHKAFVDVNEEGTEAAAATGVVIERTSVAPPPPVFRADHPFLFLIRHEKTGVILFIGRVMNPKT